MKLALAFFVIFILGCSRGEEPTRTPEPTKTPVAQVNTVTPVPTVIPTVTPTPTIIPQLIVENFRTVVAGAVTEQEVTLLVPAQATSTPIILTLNPSNIILELPPTPTPIPTTVPTPSPTATPVPPTPTPTPVIFVGTVDVHLTLPLAPNGVSGYVFDVVVGPHVALVDFKTVFSLSDRVANRISAVDLARVVEEDAVNVTLGTITFEAVSLGAGPIEIKIAIFDDDDGFPIIARFDLGFIEVR